MYTVPRLLLSGAVLCVLGSCQDATSPIRGPAAEPTIIFTEDNRLCTIAADGRNLRVIASDPGGFRDWQACLSPDESKIVYRALVEHTPYQLFLYDRRTETTRRITTDSLHHDSPTFSPDGKDVLFLTPDSWMQSIFVKRLETDTLLQLTHGLNCYSLSCSSDGAQIVFHFNNAWYDTGIRIIDRDGSMLRTLPPGYDPVFFPDGDKILFQYPTGEDSLGLFTMTTDGANKTFLTTIPWQTYPHLSPDGSRIVYTHFSPGNSDIFIMNHDGTGKVNLTHDATAEYSPRFSRDGSTIVFVSVSVDSLHINLLELMNADGSNRRSIFQSTGWLRDPSF